MPLRRATCLASAVLPWPGTPYASPRALCTGRISAPPSNQRYELAVARFHSLDRTNLGPGLSCITCEAGSCEGRRRGRQGQRQSRKCRGRAQANKTPPAPTQPGAAVRNNAGPFDPPVQGTRGGGGLDGIRARSRPIRVFSSGQAANLCQDVRRRPWQSRHRQEKFSRNTNEFRAKKRIAATFVDAKASPRLAAGTVDTVP